MEIHKMITFDKVRELFFYDEHTGIFVRKISIRSFKAGEVVGSKAQKGYLTVYVEGRNYRLHRLAWLYCYGEFPKEQIDHINGNPEDNRIRNLRVVSNLENHRNMKKFSTNKSGVVGVSWSNERQKWVAAITVKQKVIPLGRYLSFDNAVSARKNAEKQYGFHNNHGMR